MTKIDLDDGLQDEIDAVKKWWAKKGTYACALFVIAGVFIAAISDGWLWGGGGALLSGVGGWLGGEAWK